MGQRKFAPTDEQAAIIAAAKSGDDVKVTALAGTGKTTTMQLAAEAMNGRTGLYLAFNKAIQTEAAGRFPAHVTARTAHSLAYAPVGKRYRHRMNGPRITGKQLAESFAVEGFSLGLDEGDLAPASVAAKAAGTVRRFCYSADAEVGLAHVGWVEGIGAKGNREFARHVLPYAEEMWAELQDPNGYRARFEHDHYLKIWALSKPDLPYDFIMFDEAQDANKVLVDLVQRQQGQTIVVGDENQQIYCQPTGTMVTVPDMGIPALPEVRCQAPGCIRRRDYTEAQLCWTHYQQQQEGKPFSPCAPARSGSRALALKQVPIESIEPGDRVCTFDDKSHVYRSGRPVTSITRLPYEGPMVTVNTELGLSSSYTPEHHCVVRIGDELHGKHLVYLMRRGDSFRVGRVPFFYTSQNNLFGISLRASQEGADAAWLLSVHDTAAEAALAEALTQHEFNLPGVRFEATRETDLLDVDRFWEKHGPNTERAELCLRRHGRLIDFPLWTGGHQQLVGVRRPFVTAAANLVDGMRVLPFDGAIRYKNKRDYVAPKQRWVPITVSTDWYRGDIVSLEVADHHTYFGDGILTHNSWRGAVNAIKDWPAKHHLALTESFRFGPEIAAAANQWLSLPELDCDLRLTGRGPAGYVGKVASPETILCRTNAGAIREALDALDEPGSRVAVVGGGTAIRDMAFAALDLQSGKRTSHPELAAFESWAAVQQFVDEEDSAQDLAVFVHLVDEHGSDTLIDAVAGLVDQARGRPTVTISTAHKSKGLEWSSVRIGDDFREPALDEAGKLQPLEAAEAMLSYVAVTRAKAQLDTGGVGWIDSYLAGRATAAQTARWRDRRRRDRQVKDKLGRELDRAFAYVDEERKR